MPSTFSESAKQTGGAYANDYLWSNTANWSGGALPGSTASVTLDLSTTVPAVVDTTITVGAISYGSAGTLLVGGALNAASATVASGDALSVLAGGSLHLSGALTINNGTVSIAGSATAAQLSGTGSLIINTGGSLEVTSSITSPAIVSLNGGSVVLDNTVVLPTSSTFTFGTGIASLDVEDLANFAMFNFFNAPINSLGLGDSIQFGTLHLASVTYTAASHSLVLVASGSGINYTVTNLKLAGVTAPGFSLTTAADGGTIVTLNCFLSGTRIETPDGPVAIESLAAGDLIVTIENGARRHTPVRWVGMRRIDLSALGSGQARDATPLRIKAGAFSDGVPARDLLVTPEHCIYDSGNFIPARMLVNGSSISAATELTEYTVYHVECDKHAILLAEGLPTESYLDTGNRAGFGLPDPNPRRCADWARDAAAPLVTAREIVEPLWRRLAARAGALGLTRAARDQGALYLGLTSETPDPAVRLVLDDGTVLQPRRRQGTRQFFMLPRGARHAVLHSRSMVPADFEGPFIDDRRRLGICVSHATLWTDLKGAALPIDPDAKGWHRPDSCSGRRWTDGEALLALPALEQPTLLEIEFTGAASYPAGNQAAMPAA